MKKILAGLLLTSTSLLAQAEVSSKDAWIRLLPPSMKTTAGYVTLSSTQSDRLIKVSSDLVDTVEIHEMTMNEGVMQMAPVDSVDLPANTEVSLKPGGLHLMLIGLKDSLKEGQDVPVKLTFSSGESQNVSFKVKRN